MITTGLRGFGKIPDPIANAPELWPWLTPYYQAFETISNERPKDYFSGNVGYIPWSVIDRYCQRNPHLSVDFSRTYLYIKSLDAEYVNWVRGIQASRQAQREAEQNQKADSDPANSPTRPYNPARRVKGNHVRM